MQTRSVGLVLAAGVLVSGAWFLPGCGEQKVAFIRTYAPGKYLMTLEMVHEGGIAERDGQAVVVRTEILAVLGVTVERAGEPDDLKMLMTYRRIKYRTAAGLGEMSFDSDTPGGEGQDKVLGSALGELLKSRISVLIGANGDIKKVEGLEEIGTQVAKDYPVSGAIVARRVREEMGESMVRQFAKFQMDPGQPVAVGDEWKVQQEMPVRSYGGDLEMTCVLKALEKGPDGQAAVITCTGKTKEVGPTTLATAFGTIAVVGTVERTGTVRTNPATLIPTVADITQRASGEATITTPRGERRQVIREEARVKLTVQFDSSPEKEPAKPTTRPSK